MNELDEWTTRVCAALNLHGADSEHRGVVLDLARDVAHGVLRPAAPWTAYLLGLAVARGADPVSAAAAVADMARGWAERSGSATG